MTNEETLQLEKVIADTRNELTVLTGTIDPNKLTALVLEKLPRMIANFDQVLRHIPTAIVSGQDRDSFIYPFIALLSIAEMAERRSDWKGTIVKRVAEYAPRITANVDKIAQVLLQK